MPAWPLLASLPRPDFGDWLRWGIGGLVAGLIAWGTIGAKLASLETMVQITSERAKEDRELTRMLIRELDTKVQLLGSDLQREREERKSEQYRPPDRPVPQFERGLIIRPPR